LGILILAAFLDELQSEKMRTESKSDVTINNFFMLVNDFLNVNKYIKNTVN